MMFEPFWKKAGDKATVVILGWHTMSYFSDASHLCWFLEPLFAKEVHRLHRIVGNAVTDNRYIVVGVGSTQLIHAVFFALSSTELPHSVGVVSAAPYYSVYIYIYVIWNANLISEFWSLDGPYSYYSMAVRSCKVDFPSNCHTLTPFLVLCLWALWVGVGLIIIMISADHIQLLIGDRCRHHKMLSTTTNLFKKVAFL